MPAHRTTSNCASSRPTARVPCSPRPSSAAAAGLPNAALLYAFLALPLVTFKIVAAIDWEALRLWFKGANGATPKCRNREYHLGGRQRQ